MKSKNSNWYAGIIIIVLVVILIVLSYFLVRQYRAVSRQQEVSAERAHFADLLRHHSLTASDTDLIAPWMTFNYVSVSFKVPAGFLASALDIATSTPRYPNITLGRYARTIATSSSAVTDAVQTAVKNYLTQIKTVE